LIDLTTFAPLLLLLLGGISALYGTIVFPSQPSIKTSLAYSSIGHMGFSLMVCGMGLYSASLLHLVAHSFYKAHSFLSSGSAIDKHRLNQLKGNIEFKATIWNAATGFLITCILYLVISELWGGVAHHNFQFLVLGIIIIVGVFSYMIQVTSLENGLTTILKSTVIAGFVLLSFFSLESSIASLIGQQVPALSNPSTLIKMASIILLIGFIMTVFIPMFARTNTNKWETYRRNGFYLHVIFDRLVSSEKVKNTK
ncbi:MAG: proton-conducting transporter membrane subunit, partial [Flammeovirgaceae bacterium]